MVPTLRQEPWTYGQQTLPQFSSARRLVRAQSQSDTSTIISNGPPYGRSYQYYGHLSRCARSLYLAYDLLGGRHGPLRLLTRAVTYSIVFGIGYGIGLGLFFGLASGIATGITTSIELNRAARGLDHYSLPREVFFAGIRGFAFGAGLYRILGVEFAIAFGILITIGQVFAYSRGMRPAIDYVASRRPRLTRRQFWGTVVRTVGYIATALICSALVHRVDHAWSFAMRVGLVTGLVHRHRSDTEPVHRVLR